MPLLDPRPIERATLVRPARRRERIAGLGRLTTAAPTAPRSTAWRSTTSAATRPRPFDTPRPNRLPTPFPFANVTVEP